MAITASTPTNPGRLLLTGASGLVGRALAVRWRALGGEVIELAHKPRANALTWNLATGEFPPQALENVTAVVHLAGETVGQRWTTAVKKSIHDSRVLSTRLLAERIAALPESSRPRTFVCASAIGYYGSKRKEPVDETAAPGQGFLTDVCCAWEAAATPAVAAGVRTAFARFGVVLAREGGALEQLLKVFTMGMAGPAGPGTQRVSWIGLTDTVEALLLLIRHPKAHGPVNMVSPNVCTNRELMEAMARVLNKSLKPAVPAFMLKLMFGEMAEETMLADLAVLPKKLSAMGFTWRHAELDAALRHELNASSAASMDPPYFLLQPLLWSFGFALGSVLLKRALDGGAGPLRIAFLANVAMGIMFIPGWWYLPPEMTWELLKWPLFASVLFFFGQALTFMAMRLGDVSVIAPTFGIKVVFVAIFTVMYGAGPMPGAWWVASGLSALAVFLLGLSNWSDRSRLIRTALLAATAAALYSRCDLVFQMHAREFNPLGFVAVMMTAVVAESFLLVPFFRSPLRAISREAWPWALSGSIVIAAQSAGMAWTLGHYGEAARVNVVYSTRGLWSILLVWIAGPWFGNQERSAGKSVMTRRLAGALLLLVAVGLVLVGK